MGSLRSQLPEIHSFYCSHSNQFLGFFVLSKLDSFTIGKVHMKIVIRYIFIVFIGSPFLVFGQRDNNYEYSREFIWGINKNTNSGLIGGFVAKYGMEVKDGLFQTFGVELINVKHPKEFRYWSNFTGNTFIWAKQNYLYAIRTQYGREKIIYKKAAQQGVQINGQIAGGPTFGLEVPYYIEYSAGSGGPSNTVREQFDPVRHSFNGIVGAGRLFQGLGEAKVVPGANLKAALSFEFGTFKSNVTGFELGFMAEAYTREIIIIPTATNKSFFSSAFITLFYGNRH